MRLMNNLINVIRDLEGKKYMNKKIEACELACQKHWLGLNGLAYLFDLL